FRQRLQVLLEADVPFLGLQTEATHNLLDDSQQVEMVAIYRYRGHLSPRQLQQVVAELLDPCAFIKDRLEQFALVATESLPVAPDQLGRQRQRGQRGAEFVRERGDQVGARAILLAQVGNHLQNQNGPERAARPPAQRYRLQQVGVVAAAHVKLDLDPLVVAALA